MITTEQKTIAVISREYNNGKSVSKTTSLAGDLMMDSLDRFALKLELIVTFKILISEDEVNEFATVGDVVACVSKKVEEKQKAKDKKYPRV